MSERFMARALELARAKLGLTSPNPTVGAVVVDHGKIVGEGSHNGPGTPHAEAAALAAAGELARGADVYVSLEPCSSTGRTGPCTTALIEAGVRRVVYAMDDPDPRHQGRSRQILAAAGLEVESGVCEAEASALLEPYSHQHRTGRPFVTAKFAASLDGKIAATSGDSRWISSPEARKVAHLMRTQIDAILVGSETIVRDNPELTARPGGRIADHQPLRVVLDSRGRVEPGAAVFSGRGRALVLTSGRSPERWREAVAQVADVERVAENLSGEGLDPAEVLAALNQRDVIHLLLEGGGRVHGSFFDAGLVDKVHAIIAPMILGGEGRTPVAGRGARHMADAWRLERVTVRQVGADILVEGYPQRRD